VLVVGGGALGIRKFVSSPAFYISFHPYSPSISSSAFRLPSIPSYIPTVPSPSSHVPYILSPPRSPPSASILISLSFRRIRLRHRSRAPHQARHAAALPGKAVAAVRGFGGLGGWG
jgi:hypothetical protein